MSETEKGHHDDRKRLAAAGVPFDPRRPILVTLAGLATGVAASAFVLFVIESDGLWPLYTGVACGIGASAALAAGALGPRHRLAQAAAGLLLCGVFVVAGLLLLMVTNVGALSGGK